MEGIMDLIPWVVIVVVFRLVLTAVRKKRSAQRSPAPVAIPPSVPAFVDDDDDDFGPVFVEDEPEAVVFRPKPQFVPEVLPDTPKPANPIPSTKVHKNPVFSQNDLKKAYIWSEILASPVSLSKF
ncbi:hypothetical protein FACS1894164_12470 [Spirochaetia bacterium]|nr:hypothetical protein FACS1894164_12470 [Spirochaetia bacterium]